MDDDITIHDEIKELRREVALRRAFYPKRIKASAMTEDQASWRIRTMEKAIERLEKIALELPLTLTHNPPR